MQRLLILLFLLLATALKTFAYYETALLLRLPGQQFFIFLKTSPKEKMHFFLNNTLEKRATGQKTGLNYLSYGLQNLFIPQTVPSKGGAASALWRYELATGTKQNVTNYGEVRRGKNGKMYVSVANTQNLKEVSAPDGTVSVANFQATAVSGEKLVGVLPLQPNRTLPEVEDSLFARELGKRVYEIGDFLSNARVITSDRKLSTISGGIPTNFTADIKTYYNHLPGGMLTPSRNKFPESYSFSYNGKLKDDEVYGITGSWYEYGERPYMSLLMRFPNPDPLIVKQRQYPELSSYQYASNNPIRFIDKDGKAPDEFNVDKRTGQIQKVSTKGGSQTDFFNIGTTNAQGSFATEQTLSTQRGAGSINSFRFTEDARGTISSFVIPQEGKDITGFFLEPAGPSTSTANIDRRIPEGTFNLTKNVGSDFPNDFKLFNKDVPQDRAILIHIGNFNDNTSGCLLPGCGFGIGQVGQDRIKKPGEIEKRAGFLRTESSGTKLREINSFIRQKGQENVKVNIFNVNPNETTK